VACDCPLLAAGAAAAAVNDDVPESLADDVAALDVDAAVLDVAALDVAALDVAVLPAAAALSVTGLAEATVSVAAAWANPTVTPAAARAAAPITPTVTSRTLRRSARPDVFWLPWVMGNSHLSRESKRRITVSELDSIHFQVPNCALAVRIQAGH
jgi:hypothetical protein